MSSPEYDEAPDSERTQRADYDNDQAKDRRLEEQRDDACTCATGGAYLCLRCERIAETQDIGF